MPSEGWTRRAVANQHAITGTALLYVILGHVEHHLAMLGDRYGLR
jgi:hypothetical protein